MFPSGLILQTGPAFTGSGFRRFDPGESSNQRRGPEPREEPDKTKKDQPDGEESSRKSIEPQKQNSPAQGVHVISGAAQVGQTLTADPSKIADTDGLTNVSYSLQWIANDTDISGATGSTYTLVDSDEGKTVEVKVSFCRLSATMGHWNGQKNPRDRRLGELPG